MGLTKSSFGTPYVLGGDDFAVEERKNAAVKLNKLYMKDKEKVGVATSFGIGMEVSRIMPLVSGMIFNHMSDTYDWPTYESARNTAKKYELVFAACANIDNLRFGQGCLMLRAIMWHMQTPENQVVVAPLDDFPSQELWSMGEFLYEKQLVLNSIYSAESQKEFKERFDLESGLFPTD